MHVAERMGWENCLKIGTAGAARTRDVDVQVNNFRIADHPEITQSEGL